MENRNVIETIIGALVLLTAAIFVFIAYQSGNISNVQGYNLVAKFNQVDGITIGSDVRVGGIKIGSIVDQALDTSDGLYQAQITMSIQQQIQLPKDTSAAIVSDGLLGNKYISLSPGAEEEMLKDGDKIKQTQSSINIESLIGKFMFGGSDSKQPTEEKEEPADNALDSSL